MTLVSKTTESARLDRLLIVKTLGSHREGALRDDAPAQFIP